jgi:hypothetical protein
MAYSCHCPFCNADITPITKIIWEPVAPCPSCGLPVRRTAAAFALNCFLCVFFYAWIALLPLAALVFFGTDLGGEGVGAKVIGSLVASAVAAGLVGAVGWLIGCSLAESRQMETQPATTTNPAQPRRPVRCWHCDTLAVPVETAGYCEECGKKLPPR